MKGFKNTTRTQYSMGGDVSGYAMGGYAKGGTAKGATKGAAKIAKVMGEFKKGELHSGSKEGPKVTKPAQAKAIAMSEARKAGMKAPMKKNEGGKVGKMPPLGETMKSVRRLPPELTPEQMRALEDRFVTKKRPSLGETMESVRRLPKELTPAQMRALEEGSKVRKYAEGGAVKPSKKGTPPDFAVKQPPMKTPMGMPEMPADFGYLPPGVPGYEQQFAQQPMQPPSRSQVSTEGMTPEQFLKFQYEQERAIHSDPSSPFHSMYFPKMEPAPLKMMERMEPQMPKIYEPPRPVDIVERARPTPLPMMEPPPMMKVKPPLMMEPTPLPPPPLPPVTRTYDKFRPQVMPPLMMEQPTPPLQNLGQVLQRIQQKQPPVDRGFIDRMPRMNVPEGPPPAGMAPVDPNKAMMMKHGGRAAMSKGKR
jgi:hypothetical protein